MRSRGFTLIEMLVVITISAILVAMAIPTFERMIAIVPRIKCGKLFARGP